ncbi:methylamine utilization protein MauF [Hyphomicrobium nitrativorans NL23]|uniref:Methylamine utilization protein MauF n=1 Tax=Hyphomicrobium nitrativorans NL23 TaxID=1029756 RepID=V5SC42_9HYPH|nr:cytochrome c biogenesis protein CcdA [Hyphomicrobium nitrativorans]AHB47539.1 methylamine utilization protein MauF [Hyphomicrobium nitrativorans NL23]
MAETWNGRAHSAREGVVDHIDDATSFAQPWSGLARFSLLAVSLLAGAAGAAAFAAGVPLQTAMLWILVSAAFAGGLLSTWSPCGYSSVCLLRPSGEYSRASVMAWMPTLIAHAVGYAAGALVLGGALGLAGYALGLDAYFAYTIPVFAVLLVAYGAHQFGFLNVPYPQRRCQVPHDARQRFPKWVIGLLYGFSLGLNYLTYVQTPLLYAVTGAALFSGSVTFAIGIFLVFNLGRFLPLVVNALPVTDRAVTAWLARRQEAAAMTDGALLVAAGAAILTLLVA